MYLTNTSKSVYLKTNVLIFIRYLLFINPERIEDWRFHWIKYRNIDDLLNWNPLDISYV